MSADVAEVVFYVEDSVPPCTVLKPAAFAAGDLLLFFLGQDAGSALASLTTPAGWTDQGNYNQASNQGRVWSHAYNAADPASWDFGYAAGADVAGALIRIVGADLTPVLVVTTQAAGPNAGVMTGTSVTPTGADDLLIDVACVYGANNAFVETDPPGTTDRGQAQVAAAFQAIAVATLQLSSGAATGTQAWTAITPANTPGGSFTVAVKSSSGATAEASQVPTNRLPAYLILELVARKRLQEMASSTTVAAAADAGTALLALSGTGTAGKVARVAGTAALALSGTGTARRTALPAGSSTLALLATGTGGKVAAAAGRALLVLAGSGVEQTSTSRAQTGTAALALAAAGTARRTALPTGRGLLALQGTGGALRRAVGAGTAVAALSGTGTARKTATGAGRALLALTGFGVETTGTSRPVAGSAVLLLSGAGTARRTAVPAGRTTVALSGTATARHAGVAAGSAVLLLSGAGTARRTAATSGRGQLLVLAYQGPPAPPANPPGALFTTAADRGLLAIITSDSSAALTSGERGNAGMFSDSSSPGGPGSGRDRSA